MRRTFALASTLLALGLSSPSESADERSGPELYQEYGCILCHGVTGHRGGPGGRPISPTAHSFESFRTLMRFPANNMPAYAAEFIGDEQLRRVFDYLKTVQPSPEIGDLPSVSALLEALEDE